MMIIDKKNKFIFIHVYKTGGSSITQSLGGQNRNFGKHVRFNELSEWRRDYFSFGFVRNPWDRAVSSYMYLTRRGKFEGSFEEFIKEWFTFTLPPTNPARQYTVVDGCSYIGRFEHLQEDFDEICSIIGIPQRNLPHLNVSDRKHYRWYYTAELRDIIAEGSSRDIDFFGFTFDGPATKNIRKIINEGICNNTRGK